MPLPLSYPGLRCVLEHLEAVKRAHIIGRAPGLQKVDKSIPLCLESLSIDINEITFNNLIIFCDKDGIKFEMNWNTFKRQKLEGELEKMKKFTNFYICGRSTIRVDKFVWVHSLFSEDLAVDVKLSVNSLSAFFRGDFETARSFIDARSFPLKTLSTYPDTSNLDSQVVKTAETLILYLIDRTVTVEHLEKLNNKTVVFKYCTSSRVDMVPLIKYHIETKKDIRTTFVNSTCNKRFISDMLLKFEQAFGEYRSDLDGVNERFIPRLSKFSIPINDDSRIHVYAIKYEGLNKMILKPVSGL
ncbi:hypothetical protein CRE_17404 [Caenorhabditis remanei]|uniref:DUF38 domain-containing protein n=1 Tax=Caenorhabditis remanei TaxID=31234 RepID=E3N269_CAERE|nr:hypothetical protein CRE_17404 [Caenorhabditis remanei]